MALSIGLLWLIPSSDNCNSAHDPIMIFVVASSLFNAVAYTGGPFPLGYIHPSLGSISIGYSGLGDLFVFLYFGVVATVGVPYLYLSKVECLDVVSVLFDGSSSAESSSLQLQSLKQTCYHSIPIGFLATAIIVVNNLRDRHTDIHAGKRTMAVRFGEAFARAEYFLLVMTSYGFCLYIAFYEKRYMALLPLLSLPLALPQLNAVAFGGKDGQDLNEHVGGTAKLQMIYCIFLSVGLLW
jgi:1,4-dihydroxy-2-naphthoate octaprenyltransferase